MFKRFRKNLALQILVGVVLVLAALCAILCAIGYYGFTVAITRQYERNVLRTARTAALFVSPEYLSESGQMGGEGQLQYRLILNRWQRLTDTQDATFIYAIRPMDDYRQICFLMETVNANSPFGAYPAGLIRQTTNEEYRQAYIGIYEKGLDHAVIVRDRGDSETGNHITVLLPLYDVDKNVAAILCVQRPMNELSETRVTYVRHVLAATGLFLLVTLLAYGAYLSRRLLAPIQRIAGEALRFARENTQPDVPLGQTIRTQNEIGQLARTIDQMEDDIQAYIENLTRVTKEQEQIKAELDIAREIQAAMLSKDFALPGHPEISLYATMTPAKEVGGDFYDFFMIDGDHLAMVMADVSGKGIAAALFMVIAKTLIKNRAQMGGTPSTILGSVNNQLCEGNEAGLFVTVWLGILEISTGKVAASNAGHEYPAIKRASGEWELMKSKHSPAVATLEGLKFREEEFELRPGDNLYLYTDGVAEATNSNEELFGTDRMIDALNRHAEEPPEELLASMKREVDAFVGDAPQFDDITMLAVRRAGGPSAGGGAWMRPLADGERLRIC